MKRSLQHSIFWCWIAAVSLQGVGAQAAPMVRVTAKESQLEHQRQQVRRWIVDASQFNLNLIAKKELGWIIADIRPSYLGSPVVEERGFMKNGIGYPVPNSETKPLFKGKYTVVAFFGDVPQADGSYRMESDFPNFRMGPHQAYYGIDAEPLLWGGTALIRLNDKTKQPITPVVAIPKEWVSDIKAAVEKRRQDPNTGQLQPRTIEQLLEMLPAASPVESFPILRALLLEASRLDSAQRETLRQHFIDARGLKRAAWLAQALGIESAGKWGGPIQVDLKPIFNFELAEKIATEISAEDAVSTLGALEVAGIRIYTKVAGSGFGYDLLHALAAQTRFQTDQSDDAVQIRTLLREMGVAPQNPAKTAR